MKSPNAKGSMRNLEMAKQLVRHAWEDLKNDSEVRDQSIHSDLRSIEQAIEDEMRALRMLGY